MTDLDDTYRRLARPWSHEELATRYREADERGTEGFSAEDNQIDRPIALVATAFPRAATVSVAVHVLHALPGGLGGTVAQGLVDTAGKNAGDALHRCHRALELDGETHSYTVDQWLPTIYELTAQLLESARLDSEPPALVQVIQEAIGWMSRAVIELDQDSAETSSALAEALARLFAGWVFATQERP